MASEMPQPPQPPVTRISERVRWWGAVVFLAFFAIPDYLLADVWYRGQCSSRAALTICWFLIPPQLALLLWLRRPSSDFSLTYDPPAHPLARSDRWHVELPGWHFAVVFAGVFMGLGLIAVVVTVAVYAIWEVKGTLGGTVGLTFAWLVVAGALGYRFRSRPRLEVDETRRELVWLSKGFFKDPLTIPFSAVADIRLLRVQTGDRTALHIELVWQTGEGQTRTTRLPGSESQERVEAIASQLRTTVGLPPTPTGTIPLTDEKPQPSPYDRWPIYMFVLAVMAGNVAIAWVWYHQIRSAAFPVTGGTIVGQKEIREGKSYRLLVEYQYELNGTEFTSNHIWYESIGPNYATYQTLAAKFPVGASVAVSYNPANPAEALLLPGLQGVDVISLWILWWWNYCVFLIMLRPGRDPDAAAFYRLPPVGVVLNQWRFALPAPPQYRSVGGTACFVVLLAFIVVRESSGLFPTLWTAIGMTAAIIAMSFGWVLLTCEAEWLEVDATKRELRWHHGLRYTSPFRLPFEATTAVRTAEVELVPGETVYRAVIDYYTVRYRTRSIDLPTCADRAQIEAVVAWLRSALGLPPTEA